MGQTLKNRTERENIKERVESMRSKHYSTGIVGLSFCISLSLSLSPQPEESLSTVNQQLAIQPIVDNVLASQPKQTAQIASKTNHWPAFVALLANNQPAKANLAPVENWI